MIGKCLFFEIILIEFQIRFIPRRIDLDCDFALDMLVTQNLQLNKEQITANQQRRSKKRTNQTNSAKKTLELLEHFMPQNRRIYNFGVKTNKPQPIGIKYQIKN